MFVARIAIIGAGIGGMSAAIHLARKGHDVTIYEKNHAAGGKLTHEIIDGFHFDTGPALLTLPQTFSNLGVELPLVRLDHPFRYHFPDGSSLETHDDKDATRLEFERLVPGGGAQWKTMMAHGRRVWEVAERSFLTGAMYPLSDLVRRFRSPLDFVSIDPVRSLAQRGEKLFSDTRMRQWFNRYATYSGSSPWRAPATLSCIPYVEQQYGSWYIKGGLAQLAQAMAETAEKAGAQFVLDSDVSGVHAVNRVVHAITVNGERIKTDAVVSNADAEHLYRDLFPDRMRRAQVNRAGRSTSCFTLLLGLKGTTPELTHHTVWFSGNQKKEFEQIASSRGIADDPTIYACVSSVSDPSQAPYKHENWNVLVNAGAGTETGWQAYAAEIVDRLGIGDRVVSQTLITPSDLENSFRSPGGAIYGTSSNGRHSAFLRTRNRGPAKGLYLVGGSTHPGGGLPLVAMSGGIVANLIEADKPWQ